jgi:hypothetical protein
VRWYKKGVDRGSVHGKVAKRDDNLVNISNVWTGGGEGMIWFDFEQERNEFNFEGIGLCVRNQCKAGRAKLSEVGRVGRVERAG